MAEQSAKSVDDAAQKEALVDQGEQADQKESVPAKQEVKSEPEPAPAPDVQKVQDQEQKAEIPSEESKGEGSMIDDSVVVDAGPGDVQPVVVVQQATDNPNLETANPPAGVDLSVEEPNSDESKDESQAEQQPPEVVDPEATAPVAAVEKPVEAAESLDVFDVEQTGDADIDDPTKTDENLVASGDADAGDPVKPAPDNVDAVASGDADAGDPVKPAPQAVDSVSSGDGDVSDPSKTGDPDPETVTKAASGDGDVTDPVKPTPTSTDVAQTGDPDIDGPTLPDPSIVQPQGPVPSAEINHDDISIEEPAAASPEPFQQVVAPEVAMQTEGVVPGNATTEAGQPEGPDEDESSKPETSDAPAAQDLQNDVGTHAVDPFEIKDASTDTGDSDPPTAFGDADGTNPFDTGLPEAGDVNQTIADQLDPAAPTDGQGGLAGIADVASGGEAVKTSGTPDHQTTTFADGSSQVFMEYEGAGTSIQQISPDGSQSTTQFFDASGQLVRSEETHAGEDLGGSVTVYRDADGNTTGSKWVMDREDGKTTIVNYDSAGNVTSTTETYPNTGKKGEVVSRTQSADGTETEEYDDGTVIVYHPDGSMTVTDPDGTTTKHDASDEASDSSTDSSSDTDADSDTEEAPDTDDEEKVDSYDENYVSPEEAIARFGDSYIRMKEATREGADVTPTPDGVESAEASGPPIWFTEGVSDPPDDGPSAPTGDPSLDEPMVAGDDGGAIDFGPDHVDEDQPELNDPALTSDAASEAATGDAGNAGQFGSVDAIDAPVDQIIAGAQEIHDEVWDAVESAPKVPDILDPDNPVFGLAPGLPGMLDDAQHDDDQDDDI